MTHIISDLAYESGRGIGQARTASQLDNAISPLFELAQPAYSADKQHRSWAEVSLTPDFILVQAKEASIGLGSQALALAREYDPKQSILDQTVEALGKFGLGLRHGGIGRGTARAIVGRTLQEMTVECYRAGGYAPLDAGQLELIGRTAKVFGWRERLDIAAAKAAHLQQHGMSAGTFDRLTQTLAKQVAQTRNSA